MSAAARPPTGKNRAAVCYVSVNAQFADQFALMVELLVGA